MQVIVNLLTDIFLILSKVFASTSWIILKKSLLLNLSQTPVDDIHLLKLKVILRTMLYWINEKLKIGLLSVF